MKQTETKVKKWAVMAGRTTTRYVALEYEGLPTLIVPKKVFDTAYDGILYDDYDYVRHRYAVQENGKGESATQG